MTLEEVRKEIRKVKNRITCILSDQDRDARRVYQDHRRVQEPLVHQLSRLRQQYRDARELIEAHEQKIEELSERLRACLNAKNIKKMIDLIRRMNGIKKRRSRHDKLSRLEAKLSNHQATTLKHLIAGFSNEIRRLEGLIANDGKKFKKLEEPLVKALETNWRYFEEFLENKRRGHQRLDEAYAEMERLRKLEKTFGSEKKVTRLNDKAQQLIEIMKLLPQNVRDDILACMNKGNSNE